MPKPSTNHKNRQAHNWLLYDQADKYLQEYSSYYKGVMLDMGCADAPYKEFFFSIMLINISVLIGVIRSIIQQLTLSLI